MSIVKYPKEFSKEYIELCEKVNNDMVELLDDFVKIKGSFSDVRGSKSNVQFILLEDFIMEQEKRENEKGRYSFSTSLLNMVEDTKSKVNKNGLDLSYEEISNMLKTAEPRINKKKHGVLFEDDSENEALKAFPLFDSEKPIVRFPSLKDFEPFVYDAVIMPANRDAFALLINYTLIRKRLNNKLKYNNRKGIKKGLTYAYYNKRRKRKIRSIESY